MDVPGNSTRPELFYRLMDKECITKDWVLIESALPMCTVLAAYLTLVLYVGPRFMASRKPYDLKYLMRVYNLFQVLYNLYFLYEFLSTPKAPSYMLHNSCHHADPDTIVDLRHKFLLYSWHYYILKVLDLADTLFMVLRKKTSHVTFLHLYHHTAMVFFTWYSNKYIKAQQATVPVLINVFVHSVMYTYYFLASLGPNVQKHLWWKKYLTILQLGQFVVVIFFLWLLYYNNCDVAQDFNIIWIINVCVIAAFFINFYVQTYIIKPLRASSAAHHKTS